jgi:hypothetical protein
MSAESWLQRLRATATLEERCSERDTVVDVYRTALGADTKALREEGPRAARQTLDKLRALKVEAQSWTATQEEMIDAHSSLVCDVSLFVQEWLQRLEDNENVAADADGEDIDRGHGGTVGSNTPGIDMGAMQAEDVRRGLRFVQQCAQKHLHDARVRVQRRREVFASLFGLGAAVKDVLNFHHDQAQAQKDLLSQAVCDELEHCTDKLTSALEDCQQSAEVRGDLAGAQCT